MKVETYEAISLDEQSGSVENELVSGEALALIESLGLAGQTKLVARKTIGDEEVLTRIPYRRMTKEEQAIFRAVMPETSKPESYGDGPIPLRALQVLAHAKSCEYFTEGLEIWHPEAGKDDPVLVGKRKNDRGWGTDLYILARWGDELTDIEVLRKKARAILMAKLKLQIAKGKNELATLEATIGEKLDSYLAGGDTISCYATVST